MVVTSCSCRMCCTVVVGLQAGHIAEFCHRVLQLLCVMELLCHFSAHEMSYSKPITPPPLLFKPSDNTASQQPSKHADSCAKQ